MMETPSIEMNIFEKLEGKNLHLLKVDIFSRLDYKSLHVARQVCSDWNQFVLEEFWFSKKRRRMMKRRLVREWKSAEPTQRMYNFPSTKGFYLACDNKTLCMGTRDNQTILLEPSTGHVFPDRSTSELLEPLVGDLYYDRSTSELLEPLVEYF